MSDATSPSAHLDTFTARGLPPQSSWPHFKFDLPELKYPSRLNCATALLAGAISKGYVHRPALKFDGGVWTYGELLQRSNQIANVLVDDLGIVPGNRVLLRGFNGPIMAAAWLAIIKAGAVAVPTMPMLRAQELRDICDKAKISHALCDHRIVDELSLAMPGAREDAHLLTYGDDVLESRMSAKPKTFTDIETSRDDVCLLAFTSGTTGKPKATMHFHRDVLAMADVVGGRLLETKFDDIHLGSPPLAFTFGLGALLVFPLRFGAAAVLVEQASPERLLAAIQDYRVTALFTAPTLYRSLASQVANYNISSLCRCISAGEPLPKATSDLWYEATGIRLIDGIGATEMMHIFISAKGDDIRAGATGKPLPGYEAVVLDESNKPMTRGVGRLAVRGPTGCRYLDDDRQSVYVIDGWNVTGDRYRIDDDGYFWFEARSDDMIISSGYNIAAPEVEAALLAHKAVREVAVIGVPDMKRGQIVKAAVVLNAGYEPDAMMVKTLQDHVKMTIAPYKYPRAIDFTSSLPKTQTGKIQRFALRQREPSVSTAK